jgi:hypothetical protein
MDSLNGASIIPITPDRPLCPPHKEDCMHDAAKMPGYRRRDTNGELRKKRADTHIGTIEDKYGEISKCPDDTHLSKIREDFNTVGIKEIVKKSKETTRINKVV